MKEMPDDRREQKEQEVESVTRDLIARGGDGEAYRQRPLLEVQSPDELKLVLSTRGIGGKLTLGPSVFTLDAHAPPRTRYARSDSGYSREIRR